LPLPGFAWDSSFGTQEIGRVIISQPPIFTVSQHGLNYAAVLHHPLWPSYRTHIHVKHADLIKKDKPDYILTLPWNIREKIYSADVKC
jgi:hypothetical protein